MFALTAPKFSSHVTLPRKDENALTHLQQPKIIPTPN